MTLSHPSRARRTPTLLALVLGLGLACVKKPPEPPTPPAVACTTEAKMCPDGSGVGRTGPNCEFAPCPGTAADAAPSTPQ